MAHLGRGLAQSAGGRFFARLGRAVLAGPGVFVRRCAVCGRTGRKDPDGLILCETCREALSPRQGGYCPVCGHCFDQPLAPPMICASCRTNPPPWMGFSFYGRYEGLLRQCVLEYKFRSRPSHVLVLRTLMRRAYLRGVEAEGPGALHPHGPDIIAPVPLHPRRLRWRGFNQSLELAQAVRALAPDALVAAQALRRVRHTVPQSALPGAKRRENIKGAFIADRSLVAGRTVLLTDDVMTTGATVEQAVFALRKAGAERVDVLTLAR